MIFLDSIGTYLITNENLDKNNFFIVEKLSSEVEQKMFLVNLEDFSKGFLITLPRKPYQRPQKMIEILKKHFFAQLQN